MNRFAISAAAMVAVAVAGISGAAAANSGAPQTTGGGRGLVDTLVAVVTVRSGDGYTPGLFKVYNHMGGGCQIVMENAP